MNTLSSLGVVRAMCERYHGYGSAGGIATYAFAVLEDERPVASFAWQPPPPPPPGASVSVCQEAPADGVASRRAESIEVALLLSGGSVNSPPRPASN